MKWNSIFFRTFILCSSAAGCTMVQLQKTSIDPATEIEIGKTNMQSAEKLAGQSDDEYTTYACGRSSGHNTSWLTYKKLGLALYSVSYNPPREDGYQNGLVRQIGIFDTTNLSVRRSPQQDIYYGQGYLQVTPANLRSVYGKPDKVNVVDTLEHFHYKKNQMVFTFHATTKQFIRLHILK